MTNNRNTRDNSPEDIFTINESHRAGGLTGAFVFATDLRPRGVRGFVHDVEMHENQSVASIRLRWEEDRLRRQRIANAR
jgi:hypothetical protein